MPRPDIAARPHRYRNLAAGVHRGTSEEDARCPDAGRLCPTDPGKGRYDKIWTLKSPASEGRQTSAQDTVAVKR